MNRPGFLGWLDWLFELFERWIYSRNWWLLVQGLPALLLAGAILVVFAKVARSSQERLHWYQNEAKASFEVKDDTRAMVCNERLLASAVDQHEALLRIALIAERRGELVRARDLLLELATPDKAGFGAAHVEIARRLLDNPRSTEADRAAAEAHLLRALEASGVNRDMVNTILAELYLQTGRLGPARSHLNRVEGAQLTFLYFARLCALEGRPDDSHKMAQKAANYHLDRLLHDPFSLPDRLGLVESLVLRDEFAEAVRTVKEGISRSPNAIALRKALVKVYLVWLDTLAKRPGTKLVERLRVAQAALADAPAEPAVMLRLWSLTSGPEKEREETRALLREQLASGQQTALAHFILGTEAWQAGRKQEARMHLEQAYKAGPQVAVVGNNLAWMLVHSDPPQLDRALETINGVLKQFPDEIRFRGTRGTVLARMKRWDEALPDLVASLPAYRDDPTVHETLAEVYKQLGSAAMAAEHGKQAAKLKKVVPPVVGVAQ